MPNPYQVHQMQHPRTYLREYATWEDAYDTLCERMQTPFAHPSFREFKRVTRVLGFKLPLDDISLRVVHDDFTM